MGTMSIWSGFYWLETEPRDQYGVTDRDTSERYEVSVDTSGLSTVVRITVSSMVDRTNDGVAYLTPGEARAFGEALIAAAMTSAP
jgi:hypothetical protein